METAKKLLEKNFPGAALEHLKTLLKSAKKSDEWKIHELVGAAFHDLCDAEGAAQAYFNAAQTDTILRSQREHFSNYIFALHYLPQVDAGILSDAMKIYNSLYRDAETLPAVEKISGEKISVAFIAPHFSDSSAARFYEPLLTEYDREKFFVTCWNLSEQEDDFTEKIRRSVDKFFDVSRTSFEETALKIREVGTDILFDLGGHNEGGMTLQIAAYRPAKIQISGIGYFDTTGTDFIDFFFTDDFCAATCRENFAEKIWTVENAFAFCPNEKIFAARKNLQPVPHEKFTFGVLNNFMKINEDFLTCLRIILTESPESEIIFRDTTPLESRKNSLAEKIEIAGLPGDRVKIFCGENNFFSDYAKIDLILDTFPYPGGMMTALALYMGVPVLNLCGELHGNRLGADMLRIAGLDELICKTPDEYIDAAINFSREKNLSALRKKICADKLTDTKTFAKNFYNALMRLR